MKTMIKNELNLNLDEASFIKALRAHLEELSQSGGFIQAQPVGMWRLALNNQNNNEAGLFLHVWLPDAPKHAAGPFAHTHVFELESRVLMGEIIDTTYQPVSSKTGRHRIVEAVCLQDTCSLEHKVVDSVDMVIDNVTSTPAGSSYIVPKGKFHLTKVSGDGIALTVIKKKHVENKNPLLAIPSDVDITHEIFDRNQLDQNMAWDKLMQLTSNLN